MASLTEGQINAVALCDVQILTGLKESDTVMPSAIGPHRARQPLLRRAQSALLHPQQQEPGVAGSVQGRSEKGDKTDTDKNTLYFLFSFFSIFLSFL